MNYTEEETDLLVADSFSGINYKQKKLLLASLKSSNPDCGKYADALIKICGESEYKEMCSALKDSTFRKKTLDNLAKKRVSCVTVKSADYPALLKQIPAPPLVLYMRGNTNLIKGTLFGVVGARKSTPAALGGCTKICGELSQRLTIVTGVADGADSAAVRGALPSGNIICVLPGGHDGSIAANISTVRAAEEHGLTLSEFTPGTSCKRFTFFLRNRIIAGLSRGVLVISAAKKSGALNTASYAADYSREVFAIPYAPGVPSGEGCNALIKKGANLCDCADDIFFTLGMEVEKKERGEQTDPEESEILALLKDEGELHLEKIAAAVGKSLPEVSALCAMLEIKGLVVKAGGNKYTAV